MKTLSALSSIPFFWYGYHLVNIAVPPDFYVNWNAVMYSWLAGMVLFVIAFQETIFLILAALWNVYGLSYSNESYPSQEPYQKMTEPETRHWFNREESARAFWAGSDDYIDYDGYRRAIGTNGNDGEYLYMNSQNIGNGKNKLYHHE